MAKSATQSQTPAQGRKPTHRLYCVVGEGNAVSWRPVGAAWPNKDGMGFSLACDAVPLHGRLVLRTIKERTPAPGGQQ